MGLPGLQEIKTKFSPSQPTHCDPRVDEQLNASITHFTTNRQEAAWVAEGKEILERRVAIRGLTPGVP